MCGRSPDDGWPTIFLKRFLMPTEAHKVNVKTSGVLAHQQHEAALTQRRRPVVKVCNSDNVPLLSPSQVLCNHTISIIVSCWV